MTRLTKKDKYEHFYTNQANCRNTWSLDGKKLEGEYFGNKTLAIDGKAIDKLGKLEDIEDELGIDLIKLLTAEKVYYYDATTDRIEETNYFIVDFMLKQIEVESSYSIPTRLDFKQYGMTWAFTRKELEK